MSARLYLRISNGANGWLVVATEAVCKPYAEIADEKENGSEAAGDVDPEDEAEAWENYLFDRMMRYDGDSASQLVAFRDTLHIMPERHGGPAQRGFDQGSDNEPMGRITSGSFRDH